MLSKTAAAAAAVARCATARPVVMAARSAGSVRWMSKGKKTKQASAPAPAASTASVADVLAENASPEALTNLFTAYDGSNPDAGVDGVALPITVSGPHAQWVEVAYAAAGDINKDTVKGLATLTAQLQTFSTIVGGSDYGIFRFFTEADHLPSENVTALNLLLTTAEPLKSLDSIADPEVKEYFVADEPTLAAWKDARAAVKAAKLSAPTVSVLNAMAAAGQSFRTEKVLEALNEILATVSPVAEVSVASAVELTAAQKKDIVKALPAYLPANKKETNVTYSVDASLTGGLVVSVDTMTIDLSSTSILVAAATAAQSGEGRL